jgi:outer membrane receptor protein involved in Fe transport
LQPTLLTPRLSFPVLCFHICMLAAWMAIIPAKGQTVSSGVLRGTVRDDITKEPLIGATVRIIDSYYGAVTNEKGEFELSGIPPDFYMLNISFIGYQTDGVPVQITAGQVTVLEHTMLEEKGLLQSVTVRGERSQITSEASLISELRQAQGIVSGISSEFIAQTQDRDAGEVVRRTPAISLQDERFVNIRGLSERYNMVMLNGLVAPSLDPDKRAFSFDMIPSGMIDKILVNKTASPELPGDFAGGVVRIFTKNATDEPHFSFRLQTSFRPGSTLTSQYLNPDAGGGDNLALGVKVRNLPTSFPGSTALNAYNTGVNTTDPTPGQLAVLSAPVLRYAPVQGTPPPDTRASLTGGRAFDLGAYRLRLLGSLNYTNTRTNFPITRESWIKNGSQDTREYGFLDTESRRTVRVSALLNAVLRFNDRHKIEVRNFWIQNGSGRVIERTGRYYSVSTGDERLQYRYLYQQRGILSTQVAGFHHFGVRHRLDWMSAYTFANTDMPDFRQVRLARNPDQPGQPFQVVILPNPSYDANSRFFSQLRERTFSAGANYSWKLRDRDEAVPELKAGFFIDRKIRTFTGRLIGYALGNAALRDQLDLTRIEAVFQPANVGFGQQRALQLVDATRPGDQYEASNYLAAGYLALESPLGKRLNLNTGLRLEQNEQVITTFDDVSGTLQAVTLRKPLLSPLPSLNLSYAFTPKQLLRAAASRTLNRPELRELAAFEFFDLETFALVQGNAGLTPAVIYNYELRFENYPGPSELFHVAAFYKDLSNPIEQINLGTSGDNPKYSFQNTPKAQVFGAEMELRKQLDFLGSSPLFRYFSVVANASYIRSRTELNTANRQRDNRPLQGQAPYLLNAGLFYAAPKSGWKWNILYNRIGPRLFLAGKLPNADVYETPRHLLEMSLAKTFKEHWEVRLSVQDIFNQPVRLFYDNDDNRRPSAGDTVFQEYRMGSYFTLGLRFDLAMK